MNNKVTYRQQFTRCGKQRCRKCREGAGHGPYWYAYWSENGRTVSKYIGIQPPVEKQAPTSPTPDGVGADLSRLSPIYRSTAEPNVSTLHTSLSIPTISQPQPVLRVYLLGQFRIERRSGEEWQPVTNRTWHRRRARALLGCLLSNPGRRLGREQVMDALWPDLDIETAANRLNGAVHELRQILEPEIARPASSQMLRLERDVLKLADVTQIWVDAETFESLLNKANTLSNPEHIERILEEAAALYDGDYLLEELYSEWAAPRREALRRGWMGLLLELADLRAARGALTSAIEPLDRLLATDPTHETAVRQLMVLLTQLDRRGEALRIYQQLASLLRRDYDADPLPETRELYEVLKLGHIPVSHVGALRTFSNTQPLSQPPTLTPVKQSAPTSENIFSLLLASPGSTRHYYRRSLELAERMGDLPNMAFVTGNLGDVAARSGDLLEAEEWFKRSLEISEHVNDREHKSWCNVALATALQDQGNLRGALECIRRALTLARAMKSTRCTGFTLVALGDLRVTQAISTCALQITDSTENVIIDFGDANAQQSAVCKQYLLSAKRALERALSLEALEAEAMTEGQLVLASAYFMLGDIDTARQKALQTMEAAREHELTRVLARSHRLLGRILSALGQHDQADRYFEQAMAVFREYEMRLDYARSLHSYGFTLVQRSLPGDELYQRGLTYLQEAREEFANCKAAIDLKWVERILARLL